MYTFQKLMILACNVGVLGSCQSSAQQVPATAAANDSPGTPAAAGATTSSGAEAAAQGYPMCAGQHLAHAGPVPPSGASQVQLAPAFLDEMPVCRAADGLPKASLPAGDGKINAKGDCEFTNGVSCHYHSGSEFVSTATSSQTAGHGELHCIFPSPEPKSPQVFGGHIVCRQRAQGEVHGALSHEVKQGAACSAALVQQIEPCASFRCCDDGTLTSPIADLVHDQRNDIRPDFRICSDALEVDCDLLANYTAHSANCPALGGVKEAVFAVAHK